MNEATLLAEMEGEADNFLVDFYADKGRTYYLQVVIAPYAEKPVKYGNLQLTLTKSVMNSSKMKVTATKKYVYTGKRIKPTVKVNYDGKQLENGKDYTLDLQYLENKVGPNEFLVIGSPEYIGEHWVFITILPKKANISKAVAGDKQVTVTMKTKVAKTGGNTYQIAYKAKGASAWKYVTTKSQKQTIKKLKAGKQYQIKVRAFKKVEGNKYTGDWGAVKTTATVK